MGDVRIIGIRHEPSRHSDRSHVRGRCNGILGTALISNLFNPVIIMSTASEVIKYAFVFLYVLNAISGISLIGEQRKPVTKGYAITALIINAILVALIFVFWK